MKPCQVDWQKLVIQEKSILLKRNQVASKKHMLDLMTFCKKIEPFVIYYKRLIKSYNNMAHNLLENEINLLLPQIVGKQKCGIITMLVSSFIGLAYEGISSFLHHK